MLARSKGGIEGWGESDYPDLVYPGFFPYMPDLSRVLGEKGLTQEMHKNHFFILYLWDSLGCECRGDEAICQWLRQEYSSPFGKVVSLGSNHWGRVTLVYEEVLLFS